MYEMLVGDSPFEGEDEEELFDAILHSKVDYPAKISADAKSIISGFLTRSPAARLGCGRGAKEKVQSHVFFGRMNDWAALEARQVRLLVGMFV